MLADFNFAEVLLQYFCLLFALCVHEAAHAAMANWCGDPTARLLGRLTLDPRKHIDPIGTVLFPLIALTTNIPFLFGWAKPVPFNMRHLRNVRRDPVLIAMAGPGSNLLIALAMTLVLRIIVLISGVPLGMQHGVMEVFLQIALSMTVINLVLMLFNLIPVPPLDGHYLLRSVLPPHLDEQFMRIAPFGLLFIIFAGSSIIGPPLRAIARGVLLYADRGIAGLF